MTRLPFLLLALELPPSPLFKDALEKNIIPQVRASLMHHTQPFTPHHMQLPTNPTTRCTHIGCTVVA